jgi:hypothetical protein
MVLGDSTLNMVFGDSNVNASLVASIGSVFSIAIDEFMNGIST